eukprot:7072308-Ditylum_brightwellii.AAC.1
MQQSMCPSSSPMSSQEFTRFGFLLTGVTISDTVLLTVIANIKSNADPASEKSKMYQFEFASNYLKPFCPVLKKFPSGINHDAIEIFDVSGSVFGTKPSA